MIYEFILGETVDYKGPIWGQPGPPGTTLEVFYVQVIFPGLPKSFKYICVVLPVTMYDEIQGT